MDQNRRKNRVTEKPKSHCSNRVTASWTNRRSRCRPLKAPCGQILNMRIAHEAWRPLEDEVLANPSRSGSPASWLRPDVNISSTTPDMAVVFGGTPEMMVRSPRNETSPDSASSSVLRGAILNPESAPMNVGTERAAAEAREPVDLSPSVARGDEANPNPIPCSHSLTDLSYWSARCLTFVCCGSRCQQSVSRS